MARIRGILFDKDGTLVDFDKTWFAIGETLALEAAGGSKAGADRLMEQAGYDFRARRFRPDSVFAAGTNADIVALWYPDLVPQLRHEVTVRFDTMTAAAGAAKAVAIEGLLDAIRNLHSDGYRLGVATNDSTGGAEQTLIMLGIRQMFEAAYGYDSVPQPKPAPDIVHAFCALTGLTASEVAMVGDNRHDMEMARNSGAGLAVAVLSGTGTRETLEPHADVVLASVAELPAYLASRS